MTKNKKTDFEKLLFHSDEMDIDEIRTLLKGLIVQKKRWLGGFHPDSKVRCEAFRSSGVKLGQDVFISMGVIILDGYKPIVSIADRCALGNYVTLVAASEPNNSLLCKHPEIAKRCIKRLPITIEEDVWIGTGAIVLPGVRIGQKSIIGAGAVITDNVSPNSIVAGVPARLIRTFSENC
ncbi:MAG: hypothetical protein JW734_07685 [Candidatus Omnitrophica bacterium]|nr:hypothetical protein [Candidatus Omnitrophota bacterium]